MTANASTDSILKHKLMRYEALRHAILEAASRQSDVAECGQDRVVLRQDLALTPPEGGGGSVVLAGSELSLGTNRCGDLLLLLHTESWSQPDGKASLTRQSTETLEVARAGLFGLGGLALRQVVETWNGRNQLQISLQTPAVVSCRADCG
ncbi:MAG: hypothetical protein AB1758_05335, partial [Candidatus Eremiobacterota bacterium]